MPKRTLTVNELVGQEAATSRSLSSESSGSLELLMRRAVDMLNESTAAHPDNSNDNMDELTYEIILTIEKRG